MQDCIFCKIVRGEIPSFKVYEDEKFFAFLDLFPRTKAHTLVIPKDHHRWVYEVPEFELYWKVVHKITKALQKALKPEWISYVTLGEIPHAHIHVLPRFESIKGAESFPSKTLQMEQGDLKILADLIAKEVK